MDGVGTHLTSAEKVRAHRIRTCEEEFGYDRLRAELLADSGADLHELRDLIEQGCPVEIAFEIVT